MFAEHSNELHVSSQGQNNFQLFNVCSRETKNLFPPKSLAERNAFGRGEVERIQHSFTFLIP